MRVAVAGKGGAGKSLVAATLARLLARDGARVLALDCDLQPGLALGLGAVPPEEPSLDPAAERSANGRWRLRDGLDAASAVHRYAAEAPDGVRLLQAGRRGGTAVRPVMNTNNALYDLVHRLPGEPALRDWVVIGDLAAGPRQAAFDWAPYARRILLVVEPTWQSMLTARRIERVIGGRPGITSSLVVNRARGEADARRVEDFLARRAIAVVPDDVSVTEAERHGRATLDEAPDCDAVRAIAALADSLRADSLAT